MNRKTRLLLGALAVPAAFAMAFAGCGDDDDDGGNGGVIGGGGGSGATGSDEDFVSDFCKAGREFSDEILKLSTDPKLLGDDEAAAKAAAGPLEDFANALEDMRVPSDLREWRDDFVKDLNDAVDAAEDGDVEAFDDPETFSTLPDSTLQRLRPMVAENEDCKESIFGFIG